MTNLFEGQLILEAILVALEGEDNARVAADLCGERIRIGFDGVRIVGTHSVAGSTWESASKLPSETEELFRLR